MSSFDHDLSNPFVRFNISPNFIGRHSIPLRNYLKSY